MKFKNPQELIKYQLMTTYPQLLGLAPTMYVHLALQRQYILEDDRKKRQKIMMQLLLIDESMKGYFIGTNTYEYLHKWVHIVDFGLGHTKDDLEKWEEQFK